MKSGKQKRAEIRARRLLRASRHQGHVPKPWEDAEALPLSIIAADPANLVHNNTYGPLPAFYADKAFTCRDCSTQELWTAKQQKWWYEIAKGSIWSTAVYCRSCRRKHQNARAERRRSHVEGLVEKRGAEAAAAILRVDGPRLEEMLRPRKPPAQGD